MLLVLGVGLAAVVVFLLTRRPPKIDCMSDAWIRDNIYRTGTTKS